MGMCACCSGFSCIPPDVRSGTLCAKGVPQAADLHPPHPLTQVANAPAFVAPSLMSERGNPLGSSCATAAAAALPWLPPLAAVHSTGPAAVKAKLLVGRGCGGALRAAALSPGSQAKCGCIDHDWQGA